MTILKTFAAISAASIAAVYAASVADLQPCGGAYYDPAQYICYDGDFLCPVFNGVPDKQCGQACYSEYMYSCGENNTLSILPPVDSPFILQAVNPSAPAINGQPVNAAGLHFYVGGSPATYCPTVVGSICGSFPDNETVLYGGGSALAVVVPGGQQTYVQTSGAAAFTQAHSASTYNLSSYGLGPAYQGGALFGPGGVGWYACPVTPPGSSTIQYQVFAQIPGVALADDCIGFYAEIINVPEGTYGAWQYT